MINSYWPTVYLVQILCGYYQAKESYNTLNISNLYFLKTGKVHKWRVFKNQVTYTYNSYLCRLIDCYIANHLKYVLTTNTKMLTCKHNHSFVW